ncbi:hybrid sensor histidine kinase/response regulator [Tahibacter amnicola]|uniref:histidine kinase n=1 Tax=Tahibacter amnicola TaxID=2976241 RepID=A0ABY6BFF0_9GAMM|nr:hybrid sensor histidine kinase/response regulator [Tahibacter amnicola]UXI68594.1 hybrid sensor histidine kinase/response regulator [Tahibacter amnicola]
MLDLFRIEAENQTQVLTTGLLALERDPTSAEQLEACMRASHSLKGAARIVGLTVGVGVAHVMEDCFVAAQRGELTLRQRQIDVLLRGVDLLTRIAGTPEAEVGQWEKEKRAEIEDFQAALTVAIEAGDEPETARTVTAPAVAVAAGAATAPAPAAPAERAPLPLESGDRVLRVTAENLNRLLGLAGESLVESRWLKPFAASLLRLKRLHYGTAQRIDEIRDALMPQTMSDRIQSALSDLQHRTLEIQQLMSQRLVELELFDSRSANLAHRLYVEALASRMRPFADGTHGFPRMVRDVGRTLGKPVRLEIVGLGTQVDRDMLEKLDAPLGHLLRNAVDHGIESAEKRAAAGKPAEGLIQLEAHHSGGTLQIVVADDGAGVDVERLRQRIVDRKLTTTEVAEKLSETELLEFLFLPGFTMKDTVTDISGRGVGLDVVQDMIRQVRGTVRISSTPGKGARFTLQLPLTLSVVRTLLAEIGGEPYAFPLAYINRTLKLDKTRIELLEGREHFAFENQHIGLVSARQVLEGGELRVVGDELPVIVVGDHNHTFGLVVDRFLGERELVVQPLDARLGKVKDITAGALMEDGSPTLIVDMEDMIRSIDKLISGGRLSKVERDGGGVAGVKVKRVLVVDDSLTVRELERKLLGNSGYEVEVAVDGVDGWNAVRTGSFDLVVTDVDMPRMNGIELVSLIKKDPVLKALPVMIVSYKDRPEDRQRGLDAGADYYLTKGSFHDETLLQAVVDLIGEAAT